MHPPFSRRQLLQSGVGAAAGWTLLHDKAIAQQVAATDGPLRIATFRFDATPPIGHGCCGGWIKPVEVIDDPLEGLGIILLGAGAPIVLCSVDWTGILNQAHVQWRTAIAAAVGTTPDRVAVQCVHQHNAPFACVESQRLVAAEGDLPAMLDLDFFSKTVATAAAAARAALTDAKPCTHIGIGQASVERVASNRRIDRDAQRNVRAMRGSACKDARLRALPEGLIDPRLKTISFYHNDKLLAALHYYASHPMSFYGDGRVSSDFVGLARKRLQAETPEAMQVYFTGCAGNVTAGKYNEGTPAARVELTERMYAAMSASLKQTERHDLSKLAPRWETVTLVPPPRSEPTVETLQAQMHDRSLNTANRNRPAYEVTLKRRPPDQPIVISALHLGPVRILHLPGEAFVEYQLRAQQIRPECFVAVAAYGDGGPWYIPTREEYAHGGYEVSVAFCDAQIDELLTEAMLAVL